MIRLASSCLALAIISGAARAAEFGSKEIAEVVKNWDANGFKDEQASLVVRQWNEEKKPPEELLLTFFEERARKSLASSDTELLKAATVLRKDAKFRKVFHDDVEKRIGTGDNREKKTVLLLKGIQTNFSGEEARKWEDELKKPKSKETPWPICVLLGNCK